MVSAAVWQPKTVAVYWQQEEEKAERNLRFLTNLYTKDRNKPIIPNPGLNVRVFFALNFFLEDSEVISRKVPRKSLVMIQKDNTEDII